MLQGGAVTTAVSSSVAVEMDNAGAKLTKGQKKKLKLKGKREAEAALASGPEQSSKQGKKDGKPPPQGNNQASRKRPAPDSIVAARLGGSGVGSGGGSASSGAVVPKKQRSKADESLAMQRRSKSYAFQAEPASKQKPKPPPAHAPLAKAPPAAAAAAAVGGAAAATQGGGGGVLSGGSKSLTSLQERMRAKLEGAKFRMINEELYTSSGSAAFSRYQADPALFEIYHRGYREQVAKWPENPLTAILAWLSTRPAPAIVVADFGCGDAVLARDAPPTVATCHSFDLVAVNPRVVACDMAQVPLPNDCVDVCVFCLSLMGTNLADYLREAKRVLKQPGGLLKVRARARGKHALRQSNPQCTPPQTL